MKGSMRIKRNLPDAPEPTRATFHKNHIDGYGKFIRVIPSVYNPKPAPIPKPRPKPKVVEKKPHKDEKITRAVKAVKNHWWTEERINTLIELHRQGLTFAKIAKEMGSTKSAVSSQVNRLVERGILEPRVERYVWAQEELDTLMNMRAEGKSFGEIGDKLGKNAKTCAEQYRRQNAKQRNMRSLFS